MKKLIFFLLTFFSLVTVHAQMVVMREMSMAGGNSANSAVLNMSSQKNIIENLGSSGGYTSLVMAIQSADLIELLQKEGPYTFFAPSNESFTKFMQADIGSTDDDKKKLSYLIKSHIVSGKFDVDALTKMIKEADGPVSLTSLSGEVLQVTKKGKKIIVTDAKGKQSTVVTSNLEQSNGVIHIIDKVLTQ